MNILIVISDFGLGGAQKVAVSLANGLAEKDNIYLYDIAPEVRREELMKEISDKVSVIKHKVSFFEKILLKLLYAILSLFPEPKKYEKKLTYLEKNWFIKRFVRENKIDIINTHLWWADKFIIDTFGDHFPCPLVISSHGDHRYFSTDNRIPGYSEQLKYAFSKAACITYLSDNFLPVVSKLELKPAPRLVKVLNAFNLEKPIETKIEKKNFTFILASRAIDEKGWREAIECIILLQKNGYSESNLLLAGDGELLDELKQKYPKEKYPFISFLGYVSDVVSYINCSDVVLLPAYHEQMPTFVIEGLFLGKPIIATDVGEIRDMITYDNELSGILISIKNGLPDIKELYAAMHEVMSNAEKRTAYSRTALKAYKKFNHGSFISQYRNLFSSLININ